MTRRGVLKKGLLGGVLLFIGGGGFLLSRRSRRVAVPSTGLRVLDPLEYSVLAAVAARMLPRQSGAPSVEEVAVALHADRVLVRAHPGAQSDLKQLLRLFDNALVGFLFGGHTRPFTALPESEQDEVLREWQESRWAVRRTGFQALRTLVTATYYGSSMSWAAVGYPGPPEAYHAPNSPLWVGGGVPRPDGNGVFHEEDLP